MIASVDRIVITPICECPPLVEAVLENRGSALVTTFWVTVEKDESSDFFVVTDVMTGEFYTVPGHHMVKWLKPEDMNSPAIQAELLLGLQEMGITFE